MRIFTMLHECCINASQNAAISLFEQLLLYGLITACSRFERTVIAARYLCCMRCSDVRCLYEQGMVCQEPKRGKLLYYKTYFLTWSALFSPSKSTTKMNVMARSHIYLSSPLSEPKPAMVSFICLTTGGILSFPRFGKENGENALKKWVDICNQTYHAKKEFAWISSPLRW